MGWFFVFVFLMKCNTCYRFSGRSVVWPQQMYVFGGIYIYFRFGSFTLSPKLAATLKIKAYDHEVAYERKFTIKDYSWEKNVNTSQTNIVVLFRISLFPRLLFCYLSAAVSYLPAFLFFPPHSFWVLDQLLSFLSSLLQATTFLSRKSSRTCNNT